MHLSPGKKRKENCLKHRSSSSSSSVAASAAAAVATASPPSSQASESCHNRSIIRITIIIIIFFLKTEKKNNLDQIFSSVPWSTISFMSYLYLRSQYFPSYCLRQLHSVVLNPTFLQVPPFWQGLG